MHGTIWGCRDCPRTVPCVFRRTDGLVQVKWHYPHTVLCRCWRDGQSCSGQSDARSPCHAGADGWSGLGGWHSQDSPAHPTVQVLAERRSFGVDGMGITGQYTLSVRANRRSSLGRMARPMHNAVQVKVDGWSRFVADGTARAQRHAGFGLTDGPVQGGWHFPHTVSCGFEHDGRSDSGSMALPADGTVHFLVDGRSSSGSRVCPHTVPYRFE